MIDKNASNGTPSALAAGQSNWAVFRKLLHFGLRIKRWLLIGIIGIGVCAVGIAFVIKNLFDLFAPDILPYQLEGAIVVSVGAGLIVLSIYGLFRSIGPLLFRYQSVNSLGRTIYERRSRERGPKIVAIGGGTGLSVLLRGLKTYTDNITAVVTVADDGGSSGRLRRELGLLPPGDFRNCLVALSDDEGLVADLFQYRFDRGDGLEGHSFGNLFIAAMAGVTGSFEQALYESSRVLAVHGRILPATMGHLSLSARLSDGTMVRGESSITERGGSIDHVLIEPADSIANPAAVAAIGQAHLVVIGPGSLYTSVLPNLLVSGIADALRASDAPKIYVCNVATEKGETHDYSVADHIKTLQKHTFPRIADFMLANQDLSPGEMLPGVHPVAFDMDVAPNVRVVNGDLVDPNHPIRHDSVKLAQAIMDVYHGKLPAEKTEHALVAN